MICDWGTNKLFWYKKLTHSQKSRSLLYTLPLFEFEQSLIYRGGDQKMEGKLVCYLRWINMYSSAGSNQENNHFSLDNKSTWVSFKMIALLLELDPVECTLLSLYGQTENLLTVQAMLTLRQIQVQGDWRQDPRVHSLYKASLSPALDVTLQPKPGLSSFWMIPWLFYDILDINIAGILYIPSPYLYVFS